MKRDFSYKERFHSKKKKKAPEEYQFFCRLKIDKKTIILCRTEESYKNWMRNYPNATKRAEYCRSLAIESTKV